MNAEREDPLDRAFDERLRALGPDLPEPAAPKSLREAIETMLLERAAETRGVRPGFRWSSMAWVSMAAAAALALLAAHFFQETQRMREELALLRSAQHSQTPADAPRLAVVAFDHMMCPIAAEVRPKFAEMMRRHSEDPVDFLTLYVADKDLPEAHRLAGDRGLEWMFQDRPVMQSGSVNVVDLDDMKILATAIGARGVDQVEQMLNERLHPAPNARSPLMHH